MASDLNSEVGNVLKGEYTKRGKTLDNLAAATGIPYSTLRRKIAGAAPILVQELIDISAAIGIPAAKVLDEAEELMSAAPATKDELDAKRKQKRPAPKTVEEAENYEGDQAATGYEPEADAPDSE